MALNGLTNLVPFVLWISAMLTGIIHSCELPDCYEDYRNPPVRNPPQFIHFTYTGSVSDLEREAIKDLFPDTLKNPNGCPVSITIFLVSQGSDDCVVHKLYVRGHEIALAGINRTNGGVVDSWGLGDWERNIDEQLEALTVRSRIPLDSIAGMRAQQQKPGGNDQFSVLHKRGFYYDSTLQAGPTSDLQDPDQFYPWPFTLDTGFQALGFQCRNPPCPDNALKLNGFWEVPLVPLLGPGNRPCAYLDDCTSRMREVNDVTNLLNRHFQYLYNGGRAPMQINLQARTLRSKIATDGIRNFLELVLQREDTWLVGIAETLEWMRNPVDWRPLEQHPDLLQCTEERPYSRCDSRRENSTRVNVTLREVIDVDQIWIWQTVVLIVLYIVFFRYDRMVQNEKKKKS